MARFRLQDIVAIVLFVGVSFVAATIGSLVTTASLDPWYEGLEKPDWTPTGAVIGTVWTVLYTLMGIAGWLVWRQLGWVLSLPYLLFGGQLTLNVLWSVVFFGLQNPAAGFVMIVLLGVSVLATLISFWRVTLWAGVLFLPYITWVTIAGTLNFLLWQLNP